MRMSICFVVAPAIVASMMQGAQTPRAVVDELLAADRQFAADGAKTTVVPALNAMFADDVVLPVPGPKPSFARGRSSVTAALNANPENTTARLQWSPVRGGISADGQHGFTYGYVTMTGADGATVTHGKYVSYWVKGAAGWRVAVYRRVPADGPPPVSDLLPPALPARLVPPTTDAALIARHKASLEAAEQAFSDEAQTIGLGPAFANHGTADAMNVGPRGSATFIIGAADIARSVGAGSEGKPSPVTWAADEGSLVASSGDLGVTLGFIRQNARVAAAPGPFPFFTIWRRADPSAPWRYVAE